ncbi:MAG: hypothetical protein DWQ05_06235 [Calditrichaeota bacterium]|nr:MAG: hypothetical protein DWQ05_06235 [Calditrichota bacterium]
MSIDLLFAASISVGGTEGFRIFGHTPDAEWCRKSLNQLVQNIAEFDNNNEEFFFLLINGQNSSKYLTIGLFSPRDDSMVRQSQKCIIGVSEINSDSSIHETIDLIIGNKDNPVFHEQELKRIKTDIKILRPERCTSDRIDDGAIFLSFILRSYLFREKNIQIPRNLIHINHLSSLDYIEPKFLHEFSLSTCKGVHSNPFNFYMQESKNADLDTQFRKHINDFIGKIKYNTQENITEIYAHNSFVNYFDALVGTDFKSNFVKKNKPSRFSESKEKTKENTESNKSQLKNHKPDNPKIYSQQIEHDILQYSHQEASELAQKLTQELTVNWIVKKQVNKKLQPVDFLENLHSLILLKKHKNTSLDENIFYHRLISLLEEDFEINLNMLQIYVECITHYTYAQNQFDKLELNRIAALRTIKLFECVDDLVLDAEIAINHIITYLLEIHNNKAIDNLVFTSHKIIEFVKRNELIFIEKLLEQDVNQINIDRLIQSKFATEILFQDISQNLDNIPKLRLLHSMTALRLKSIEQHKY